MLGKAAVAMWWDIAPGDARRVGGLAHAASTCPSGSASRASCAARAGSPCPGEPSYFVLYEAARLETITGGRVPRATEQSDAVVAKDDAAPSQHGAQPVRGSRELGRRGAADAGDDPFFSRQPICPSCRRARASPARICSSRVPMAGNATDHRAEDPRRRRERGLGAADRRLRWRSRQGGRRGAAFRDDGLCSIAPRSA